VAVGGFDQSLAVDLRRFDWEGGPFADEVGWDRFLLHGLVSTCPPALWTIISNQPKTYHDIVLTHSDLEARNIMVRVVHVAIIHCGRAGFYDVGYYNILPDLFPGR
jgi:hypothetical protein